MGGKGAQVEVRDGSGELLGTVWESGHFTAPTVEGRVRRTPAGWAILVEEEPAGTIDREGRHSALPLRLDGLRVVDTGGREIARVEDVAYAAGALALVAAGPAERWQAPPAAGPPWALIAGGVAIVVVLGLVAAVLLF